MFAVIFSHNLYSRFAFQSDRRRSQHFPSGSYETSQVLLARYSDLWMSTIGVLLPTLFLHRPYLRHPYVPPTPVASFGYGKVRYREEPEVKRRQ